MSSLCDVIGMVVSKISKGSYPKWPYDKSYPLVMTNIAIENSRFIVDYTH